MGSGEDWMGYWRVFLKGLGESYESRLAYLRRHPPAPVVWADMVYRVLHPSANDRPEEAEEAERREELYDLGLIDTDVAYRTWRSQQSGVWLPWEYAETPETAARYHTRDLWFWSRQVADLRGSSCWEPPTVPGGWEACATELATGQVGTLDPTAGLLSLARSLSAGRVVAPWQLGLKPADFADTFDDDMGYADAFRLWGMSAFDDGQQVRAYLAQTTAPAEWVRWCDEHFPLG
jgi:hypothetical protein